MSNTRPPVHESDTIRTLPGAHCAYTAAAAMPWRLAKPGIHVKALYESPSGHERTLLFKLEPGAESAPHAHDEVEQIYVIEGEFFDGERLLRAGDTCVRPPGVVHTAHSETGALALVVYKQPVTRGDIEQVRGVSVSQNIMRTLLERDWVKIVGHKEAPGRPALYGTTRAFLDYFNLKNINELPPLPEIRALIEPQLEAGAVQSQTQTADAAETPPDDSHAADEGSSGGVAIPSEKGIEVSLDSADEGRERAQVVPLRPGVKPGS